MGTAFDRALVIMAFILHNETTRKLPHPIILCTCCGICARVFEADASAINWYIIRAVSNQHNEYQES